MALLHCPECGGDGSHIYVGGPGYYDSAYGNYLPSETEVECPTCQGEGVVEFCDTCRSTADLCICTEDELGVAA